MKRIIYFLFLSMLSTYTYAQVGIDTETPEAALDIVSTSEGILIPRLSLTATNVATPVGSPNIGELIFNNATAGVGITAVTPGFYYWNGVSWSRLKAGSKDNPSLSLSGANLSISDGNTIDLSGIDTDDQILSIAGGNLTISEGNMVDISGIDTDTDDQTLSLSNGVLSISEGNTVDLNVLSDHDWYVGNTASTIPSAIGNNIYTNGSVGIGASNPSERLSVYPDTDVSAEIGRAHVGNVGHTNWAAFSHVDANATGSYALLQNESGQTLLNSASGQDINIRNNNVNQAVFEADGDFGVGTTNPASKVEVVGDVRLNGNNAGIIYQNKETNKDWRLVYVDGFEGGVEGWVSNQALSSGDLGLTRQSANIAGLVGNYIRPTNNNYTLKKYFNLSGLSYSEVKVEFNYFFLDSWDDETAWLAVKSGEAANPTMIWNKKHNHDDADMELNGTNYNVSFFGNGSWSDLKSKGQAQFSWSGGGFWIEFGANLDGDTGDETFGVDNVMIYVR